MSQAAMLPDHMDIAEFAVGFATGFIVLAALFHVRAFAQLVVSLLAAGILYTLATEGVPVLMDHMLTFVRHVERYETFLNGVLVGKLAAGLVKWGSSRCRRATR